MGWGQQSESSSQVDVNGYSQLWTSSFNVPDCRMGAGMLDFERAESKVEADV